MLRAARPAGTIVNIASVLAHVPMPQLTDYSGSKAALTMMHKCLAIELKSYEDIKLVLVEPGHICTPMFDGLVSPNRFFAPTLDPVDVAREVIKTIDAGVSAHVAMPLYARWIAWMDVLPVGVQVFLRWVMNTDHGPNGFRGRNAMEKTTKEKQ